jgi:hypothetical protein
MYFFSAEFLSVCVHVCVCVCVCVWCVCINSVKVVYNFANIWTTKLLSCETTQHTMFLQIQGLSSIDGRISSMEVIRSMSSNAFLSLCKWSPPSENCLLHGIQFQLKEKYNGWRVKDWKLWCRLLMLRIYLGLDLKLSLKWHRAFL